MMIAVEFRGISKEYNHRYVLQNVNLTVEAGKFMVILGEPACGKSVLLRLLTGLEPPTTGQTFMRGVDVTRVPAGERNVGYVPQSFALYPHYSVYDNIAYPLKLLHVPRKEVDQVVHQAAELLKIIPLLNKHPDQCSGGEKQRVAIARGIVKNTDIFVFDDPLTGLDFKLREQLFDDMRQMQEALKATFVYTTSDPLEALMLAQDVAVIADGTIVEAGPLSQVYAQPTHVHTMQLLGYPQTNLIAGQIDAQGHCRTHLFEFPVQLQGRGGQAGKVMIALRPKDIELDPASSSGLLTFPARVTLQEDLGGELMLHLETNGVGNGTGHNTTLLTVVRHDRMHTINEERVMIGVNPRSLVVYSADKGDRIGQGA